MTTPRTFGEHAWAFESEKIAALPDGTYSLGVGDDLAAQSGLTDLQLASVLAATVAATGDGVASISHLQLAQGHLVVYVRRRGKAADAGTRCDFEALGWAAICDALDAGAASQS